jgi:serine protease Do
MSCLSIPGRSRPISFSAVLAVLAGLAPVVFGAFCCDLCRAQQAIPAGLERFGPVTAEKRAELYASLRRNAELMEAQAAVVKTVAKLMGPTVVQVEAETTHRSSLQLARGHRIEESGSGVIVDFKGKFCVLTNRHVVAGAALGGIRITLADGRVITPDKVWDDPASDVAVMQVTASGLLAAPLGNSDTMEIGDFVLALGSPFGLTHSVTYGIISARGRHNLELGDSNVTFQDFMQIDANINPGNSGGPLVNLRGEVIGINTAIASISGRFEGIGFSIPINMFAHVARQLAEHGAVVRGFMGVSLDKDYGPAMAADLGLPRPTGALVSGISKDSPAERANVHVGDVVLEFNHVSIDNDSHLVNVVGMTDVGRRVPVVVFRNRQTVALDIEVTDHADYDRAHPSVAVENPPVDDRQ